MLKDNYFILNKSINCDGKVINLSLPIVMGIINITPDSFYDGGKNRSIRDIIVHAGRLLDEGATIIDIGAASTRPGAKFIAPDEEKKRLLPALEAILRNYPSAIISVDTYNSETAKAAIESGAAMINDISAGNFDEKMFEVIAEYNVPYIMMHIKGTPSTMQNNPVYDDLMEEIIVYFKNKVEILRQNGVNDIIIDPGFGFGKSLEDNYKLLHYLRCFKIFELPIMVGLSRKSMINKVLGTQPADALNGTTVLNSIALMNGADILRVHDVRQAVEAVKLLEKLNEVE